MEVFIILFVLIIISLIFLAGKKNYIIYKYIFLLLTIYLMIISGFRDISVGLDTIGYYHYFNRDLDFYDIGEYYGYQGMLFWYSALIIKHLFDDFQVLLILIGFVSIGLFSRFIWKYSRYPLLSLFIYASGGFFAIGLSLVRQYLALSLLIYAFDFIANRKILKFIFMVIVAILIHPSSLLFLPAYFISTIAVKKKTILLYIVSTIVGFVLAGIVINVMSALFFGGLYSLDDDTIGGGKITFIAYIIILLIALIRKNTLINNSRLNVMYINFLWITIMIQSTAFIFPIASRAAYMYGVFLIVFIPEIIYSLKNIYFKVSVTTMLIILLLSIYFLKFYNLNDIYPYKFFIK